MVWNSKSCCVKLFEDCKDFRCARLSLVVRENKITESFDDQLVFRSLHWNTAAV